MNDVNFYNGEYFEYHETHNGVNYWIVSNGFHQLAYVKSDQIDFAAIHFTEEFRCHGGITFKGKKKFRSESEDVIGWDYSHLILNDYTSHLENPRFACANEKYLNDWTSHFKRWTFDEVEKEVFDFIDKYRIKKEA